MNELEAKCYLTKKGGANNSDHTCSSLNTNIPVTETIDLILNKY